MKAKGVPRERGEPSKELGAPEEREAGKRAASRERACRWKRPVSEGEWTPGEDSSDWEEEAKASRRLEKSVSEGKSEAKKFLCEVCGKTFKRRQHLVGHTRLHTGEKPYRCDICGVRFRNCSNLKEHRRIHTGEHPYDCKRCGLTFLQTNHLKKHMKCCGSAGAAPRKRSRRGRASGAPENAAGPLECYFCSRTFNFQFHLQEHVKRHFGGTDVRCELCGSGFATRGAYVAHKADHEGEPQPAYQCHVCGDYFEQFCHLHVHLNRHLGPKRVRCEVCGKHFSRKSNLTSHKLEHSAFNILSSAERKELGDSEPERGAERGDGPKMVCQCHVCGKCFDRVDELCQHLDAHSDLKKKLKPAGADDDDGSAMEHESDDSVTFGDDGDAPESEEEEEVGGRPRASGEGPDVGRGTLQCPYCDRRFTVERIMKKHVSRHVANGDVPSGPAAPRNEGGARDSEEPSPSSGKRRGKPPKLSSMIAKIKEKRKSLCFRCEICDKTFSYHNNYVSHLRVHSGTAEEHCNTCGIFLSSVQDKIAHRKLHIFQFKKRNRERMSKTKRRRANFS